MNNRLERPAHHSKQFRGNFIESVIHDVSFSLRVLRNSPAFTAVAIVTLAMAIGANAIVLSVINAFILHPLNLPKVDSLYQLERGKDKTGNQSYPDYVDLRDRNRSFDGLAAYEISGAAIDTGRNPSRAWVDLVSGNFFDVLGVQPYLGSFFHGSDEHGANSAPYLVLGYSYWHTRFQDDRGVVGRVVQVNKHPFTILGVAPPEFHGTLMFFHPDFYVPIVDQEQIEGENDLNLRGKHWLFAVVGHVKPGVTPAAAIADLNRVGTDLEHSYPKDDGEMTFALARPGLYGDFLGPVVQGFLMGLLALAGLILLAACANLGSLFAARAADRTREVALRLALGSSRARILRQLFTEATLVSLMGGGLGIWGSVLLLHGLSVWQPLPKFPVHVPVNPDANVYLIAAVLALLSGFLFGAVPVRQVLHTDSYEVIKSGSRSTPGRRVTLRDVLLAGQIAICAVLVTSSMVAVRGLIRSLHANFGFDPSTLLVDTDLSMAGYRGDEVGVMQKRMIDALQEVPAVKAVGLADTPPLSNGSWNSMAVFTDETVELRPAKAAAHPIIVNVSPGYFQAAGTALLSGRDLTWHDDKSAPRVAVVNREFARRMFGNVSRALGGHYKLRDGTRVEVAGVVEDGKYTSLTEDPQPAMFLPILQSPATQTFLVVSSDRDAEQQAPALAAALRRLDSGLPFSIETWIKSMDGTMFGPRMATLSLGVLGAMGAILAITGIFGMAAYSVSKRMRELGIRMALGAQRKEILQAALGRAMKLLALGSAAGVLLGILASRVLALLVYSATPRDPVVLLGVVVAMSMLGLLAAWIPAQRAVSLDPLVLLREE